MFCYRFYFNGSFIDEIDTHLQLTKDFIFVHDGKKYKIIRFEIGTDNLSHIKVMLKGFPV